ncbi:MAG: hypothetical protein KF791_08355 [Verrucomicrobiae bacterium]|nr:hypothetical protein [Verrucomicrobiae bacterium]
MAAMKTASFLLSLAVAAAAFCQAIPGGVTVTGTLVPSSPGDTLAVTQPFWGAGGWQTGLTNSADRTNLMVLPMARRHPAMVVPDTADPLLWHVLNADRTSWTSRSLDWLAPRTNATLVGATLVGPTVSGMTGSGITVLDGMPGKIAIYGPNGVLTYSPVDADQLLLIGSGGGPGGGSSDRITPQLYGASGMGSGNHTLGVQAAINAAAAAGRPLFCGGYTYNVDYLSVPAGSTIYGENALFIARKFPEGELLPAGDPGRTNQAVFRVAGNNVLIQDVNVDVNGPAFFNLRVPLNSSGLPGDGAIWQRTRNFMAIWGENRDSVIIRNVTVRRGIDSPILLVNCSNSEVNRVKFIGCERGGEIRVGWNNNGRDIWMIDCLQTQGGIKPYGFEWVQQVNGNLDGVYLQNCGATNRWDSHFYSGIWLGGLVGGSVRNLHVQGRNPASSMNFELGVLLDSQWGTSFDGIVVNAPFDMGMEMTGAPGCELSNLVFDLSGSSGSGTGIYCRNQNIWNGPGTPTSTPPGAFPFQVTRGRAQEGYTSINGFTIINARNAIDSSTPYQKWSNGKILGSRYSGVVLSDIDSQTGGAEAYFLRRTAMRSGGWEFDNVLVQGSTAAGMRIFGGAYVSLNNCQFWDNNQGQMGSDDSGVNIQPRHVVTPTTNATAANIPVASVAPSFPSGWVGGFGRASLWNGNTYVESRIMTHETTASVIVVEPPFSVVPTSSHVIAIDTADQGPIRLVNVQSGNSQAWVESNTVSYDAKNIQTVQRLTNLVFTLGSQNTFPGQYLTIPARARNIVNTRAFTASGTWANGASRTNTIQTPGVSSTMVLGTDFTMSHTGSGVTVVVDSVGSGTVAIKATNTGSSRTNYSFNVTINTPRTSNPADLVVRVLGNRTGYADVTEVETIRLVPGSVPPTSADLVPPALIPVAGSWVQTGENQLFGNVTYGQGGIMKPPSANPEQDVAGQIDGLWFLANSGTFTGSTDVVRVHTLRDGLKTGMANNGTPNRRFMLERQFGTFSGSLWKVALPTVTYTPQQRYGIRATRTTAPIKVIGLQAEGNTLGSVLSTTAPNLSTVTW